MLQLLGSRPKELLVMDFQDVKFTGWDMGTAIEAKRRFGDKVLIGYGKDEQAVAAYFLGVRFK